MTTNPDAQPKSRGGRTTRDERRKYTEQRLRRVADRDDAIRALRALDDKRWTLPALARAFDLSVAGVHKILSKPEKEGE